METHAIAEQRQLDVTYKIVKVRKLARIVLGRGAQSHDEHPISLGPFNVTLMWRQAWKWNTERPERLSPHGLRGGPVLCLDLPVERWLSVGTQVGSYRYIYARALPERHLLGDGPGQRGDRRSIEWGMFLNVHLDGLL